MSAYLHATHTHMHMNIHNTSVHSTRTRRTVRTRLPSRTRCALAVQAIHQAHPHLIFTIDAIRHTSNSLRTFAVVRGIIPTSMAHAISRFVSALSSVCVPHSKPCASIFCLIPFLHLPLFVLQSTDGHFGQWQFNLSRYEERNKNKDNNRRQKKGDKRGKRGYRSEEGRRTAETPLCRSSCASVTTPFSSSFVFANRLNLHVVKQASQDSGLIIVDSTRKGKKFPDRSVFFVVNLLYLLMFLYFFSLCSFSRTLPIWCCVLNRSMQEIRKSSSSSKGNNSNNDSNTSNDTSEWDAELHMPLWVSQSEQEQVRQLIDGYVKVHKWRRARGREEEKLGGASPIFFLFF